jgi:TRAP-type C4-dicarboxylate transport system permease small subunit
LTRLENIAAAIFGATFLLLALFVAVETIMRKMFNTSLQGVDELGGYILASSAALAMAVALVSRAHIRIDLLHDFVPRWLRIALNTTAMAALAASAIMLLRMGWIALDETILFNSTFEVPSNGVECRAGPLRRRLDLPTAAHRFPGLERTLGFD